MNANDKRVSKSRKQPVPDNSKLHKTQEGGIDKKSSSNSGSQQSRRGQGSEMFSISPKRLKETLSNHPEIRLRQACSIGDYWTVLEVVKLLDKKGLDQGDERGRTALHFACASGHSSIARTLLKHGASPDVRDTNGNTPLHLAVTSNHLSTVNVLVEGGAEVGAKDSFQRSPLDVVQSRLNLMKRVQGPTTSNYFKQFTELLEVLKNYATRLSRKKSDMLQVIAEDDGVNAIADQLDFLSQQLQKSQLETSDKTNPMMPKPTHIVDELQSILDRIKLL